MEVHGGSLGVLGCFVSPVHVGGEVLNGGEGDGWGWGEEEDEREKEG